HAAAFADPRGGSSFGQCETDVVEHPPRVEALRDSGKLYRSIGHERPAPCSASFSSTILACSHSASTISVDASSSPSPCLNRDSESAPPTPSTSLRRIQSRQRARSGSLSDVSSRRARNLN